MLRYIGVLGTRIPVSSKFYNTDRLKNVFGNGSCCWSTLLGKYIPYGSRAYSSGGGHHEQHEETDEFSEQGIEERRLRMAIRQHYAKDKMDEKYGIEVPKPPLTENFFAKIIGAQLFFWFFYNVYYSWDHLFGFARPSFEYPFGDELSDDDDDMYETMIPEKSKAQVEITAEMYRQSELANK